MQDIMRRPAFASLHSGHNCRMGTRSRRGPSSNYIFNNRGAIRGCSTTQAPPAQAAIPQPHLPPVGSPAATRLRHHYKHPRLRRHAAAAALHAFADTRATASRLAPKAVRPLLASARASRATPRTYIMARASPVSTSRGRRPMRRPGDPSRAQMRRKLAVLDSSAYQSISRWTASADATHLCCSAMLSGKESVSMLLGECILGRLGAT